MALATLGTGLILGADYPLALLIGLPIVLVLAWYHGDRGHQPLGMGPCRHPVEGTAEPGGAGEGAHR